MKIEKTAYVLMKPGNMDIDEETKFLTDATEFTTDILHADKFVNRRTALEAKHYYECNKNHSYESDLTIIPLKTTYEW